jgi:uncharacterized membrane protein YesL
VTDRDGERTRKGLDAPPPTRERPVPNSAPEHANRSASGGDSTAATTLLWQPWRTLIRGLGAAYDALGVTLVLSFLGFIVAATAIMGGWSVGLAVQGDRGRLLASWLLDARAQPVSAGGSADAARLMLGAVVPFGLWCTVVSPLTAGAFAYVRDLLAHEHPVWRDLPGLVRAHWASAVRLGTVQAALTIILATDFVFFLSRSAFGLKLVGLLFLYPLLFWLLAQQYQWPLLVEQRQGAWSAIKKSSLLTLDNPGFTLVLGLLTGAVSVLCVAAMVGLPLLWVGTIAFLHTEATRGLLRKYGLVPPEPDPEADPGWGAGSHA